MGSDNQNLNFEGEEKNSVVDELNGLQPSGPKSDSIVVDMERFSNLFEKDINANSRITLQRNVSTRKGSVRGGDKKFNPTNATERDASIITTSPRAALHGGISTPEKPVVVPLGATTDQPPSTPQVHHQITITNGSLSSTTSTQSKSVGRRFSFRRSSPSWTFDPRRILFFFATLSSLGTILLIYFTISMSKLNGDENALN